MAKKKKTKIPSKADRAAAQASVFEYISMNEGRADQHKRESNPPSMEFNAYLRCRGKNPFHLPLAKCKTDTRRIEDIVCDEVCEWVDLACMADELKMNENDLKEVAEARPHLQVKGHYARFDGDLCTTRLSGMWVTIIMVLLLLLMGVVLFVVWKRSEATATEAYSPKPRRSRTPKK